MVVLHSMGLDIECLAVSMPFSLPLGASFFLANQSANLPAMLRAFIDLRDVLDSQPFNTRWH